MLTRKHVIIAACIGLFTVASYGPLPSDKRGLTPGGWVPDRLCWRWSSDECYKNLVQLQGEKQAGPPETPLCHYGSKTNHPACDVRYALPVKPQ